MTNKRKKGASIPSRHHPSQSSIAVSGDVKKEVKALQGLKCWLCDTRALGSHRPLQIAHVYPQAFSARYSFRIVHRFGQTQLANVHDKANLIALCEICHYAFDNEEWTFLPTEMTTWIQELKTNQSMIREYNSRRNITFQRILLRPDPESKAFQDSAYRSAFNTPIKAWRGEVGVVVLRNPPISKNPVILMDAEVRKVVEDYLSLYNIWKDTSNPCLLTGCQICEKENNQGKELDGKKDKNNDDDDVDSDSDNNNLDPNNDENSNENKKHHKNKKRQKSKKYQKNNNRSSAKDGQDVRGSKSIQQQTQSTYFTARPVKHLIRGRKRVQRRVKKRVVKRSKGDDWMCTTPYDESIPYSHRYGYTWANTTSNELMAMWQLYH